MKYQVKGHWKVLVSKPTTENVYSLRPTWYAKAPIQNMDVGNRMNAGYKHKEMPCPETGVTAALHRASTRTSLLTIDAHSSYEKALINS
jgi:hypothetical protein